MAEMAIFLPDHFHFDNFHRYMLHLCTVNPLRDDTEKNIFPSTLALITFGFIAFFLLCIFWSCLWDTCPFDVSYNFLDSQLYRNTQRRNQHQEPHHHYCSLQNIKVFFSSYIFSCCKSNASVSERCSMLKNNTGCQTDRHRKNCIESRSCNKLDRE